MRRLSQLRLLTLAAAGLCAALSFAACAGPERAPHQPIKGVDTESNDVQNPHDPPGSTGRGA